MGLPPLRPVRKVYGNSPSGVILGTVELLGLVAEKADLHGPFWDRVRGLDLNVQKPGRTAKKWTEGPARHAGQGSATSGAVTRHGAGPRSNA